MLSALAMACALAAAVGPARAAASTTQESMLQDDNQLVYASPSHVKQVLTELATLGVEPMPKTPAGMQKFIADEDAKWGKVIRTANIKAE